MTFAQMDSLMNSRVVEFLADKSAIRKASPSGAIVGESFPVIFNKRPDQSFGMVQADEFSCQCAASENIAHGAYLEIDGATYTVDKVFNDGGLLTIELGRVVS